MSQQLYAKEREGERRVREEEFKTHVLPRFEHAKFLVSITGLKKMFESWAELGARQQFLVGRLIFPNNAWSSHVLAQAEFTKPGTI